MHRILYGLGGTARDTFSDFSCLMPDSSHVEVEVAMNAKQVEELLLQSLEHEQGGVEIYQVAVSCAINADLKREWQEYLDETKTHVMRLRSVCDALSIDADKETPGRAVVRHVGNALVQAMLLTRSSGDPTAAEIVACECVVLAETKDHQDWDLLRKCAEHLPGKATDALKSAYDAIEDQEEAHVYHTKGWCRELWIRSLGMDALFPPSDERQHVKATVGTARAEQVAEPRQS
jgi:hypothetical protein